MSCDAVIFDLDGVILEPVGSGGSVAHWRSILEGDLGLPFGEAIERVLRGNMGECVLKVLRLCYPLENPWDLIQRFQEIDVQRVSPLAEGAKEIIVELSRRGKLLYVFTQRERLTTEHHLRFHSILHLLSGVHTLEDYWGSGKKHARSLAKLFEKIERTEGIPPERCRFVGDSPAIDAHVAYALARPPVFFGIAKTEETKEEFLAMGVPKQHIVSSLQEFAALVM